MNADSGSLEMNLLRLAMHILSLQGTSVPCECVFPPEKQTITNQHTKLSAEMMDALQILKLALKHRDATDALSLEHQIDLEGLNHDELSV